MNFRREQNAETSNGITQLPCAAIKKTIKSIIPCQFFKLFLSLSRNVAALSGLPRMASRAVAFVGSAAAPVL